MLVVVSNELDNYLPLRPQVDGSRDGREFLYRNREVNHKRLYRNYFSQRLIYGPIKFHMRYRMRRDLFVCIVDVVTKFASWFVQKLDALGRLVLSILQKWTIAINMLTYGLPVVIRTNIVDWANPLFL